MKTPSDDISRAKDSHGVTKRPWKSLKGKLGHVKQFGSWRYRDDNSVARCQVKGCDEEAKWQVGGVVLCFKHGEAA